MTRSRIDIALAILFLIVGIVATTNTIQLNNYMKATLPRDQQQEQCNTETLKTLGEWVAARSDRDEAADARDDAAIDILDQLIGEQQVTHDQLLAWRDAVVNSRALRHNYTERLQLPKC